MLQGRIQEFCKGGGAQCEGAKRPSPSERSERGGEGVGGGCPPSHGREIFNIYVGDRAISCILLVDFL